MFHEADCWTHRIGTLGSVRLVRRDEALSNLSHGTSLSQTHLPDSNAKSGSLAAAANSCCHGAEAVSLSREPGHASAFQYGLGWPANAQTRSHSNYSVPWCQLRPSSGQTYLDSSLRTMHNNASRTSYSVSPCTMRISAAHQTSPSSKYMRDMWGTPSAFPFSRSCFVHPIYWFPRGCHATILRPRFC